MEEKKCVNSLVLTNLEKTKEKKKIKSFSSIIFGNVLRIV